MLTIIVIAVIVMNYPAQTVVIPPSACLGLLSSLQLSAPSCSELESFLLHLEHSMAPHCLPRPPRI